MDPLSRAGKLAHGALFYAGSAGLLGAMAVETVAVLGRRAGWPLHGALELVQAAIVPAACAAMLIATFAGAHAAVHMVTERLPAAWRGVAARVGAGLAGALFAALCAGCGWLALESWNAFEQTEVLHLPFRPVRALVALAAGALALAFFWRAWRGDRA